MFRSDGADSSLFFEYMRRFCARPVTKILSPALSPVLQQPLSFEVSSANLPSPLLQEGNALNVRRAVECIVANLETTSLTPLVHAVLASVRELYPDDAAGMEGVSNLVMLRFLSPAILNPGAFRLIKTALHSSQSRALLTIAKVLQQVANGHPFESSKSLGQFFSAEWLASMHARVRNALRKMAAPPTVKLSADRGEQSLSATVSVLRAIPALADVALFILAMPKALPRPKGPEAQRLQLPGSGSTEDKVFRTLYRWSGKRNTALMPAVSIKPKANSTDDTDSTADVSEDTPARRRRSGRDSSTEDSSSKDKLTSVNTAGLGFFGFKPRGRRANSTANELDSAEDSVSATGSTTDKAVAAAARLVKLLDKAHPAFADAKLLSDFVSSLQAQGDLSVDEDGVVVVATLSE